MDIHGIRNYVIRRLTEELDPQLYYHNLDHTIDVYHAVGRYCEWEGVDEYHRRCLEAAALLHDTGMLDKYLNHEEASVEIAARVLQRFGFSDKDTDIVNRLIMVTKLPQQPAGHLESILCDSDLDYLGRKDYFIHAFKLKLEWHEKNIKSTTLREWFEIQVAFLSNHTWFTRSARENRNPVKMNNLSEITKFLNLL
jgi:exopolyphosphatase/pppGpp-phosphohydrolase